MGSRRYPLVVSGALNRAVSRMLRPRTGSDVLGGVLTLWVLLPVGGWLLDADLSRLAGVLIAPSIGAGIGTAWRLRVERRRREEAVERPFPRDGLGADSNCDAVPLVDPLRATRG